MSLGSLDLETEVGTWGAAFRLKAWGLVGAQRLGALPWAGMRGPFGAAAPLWASLLGRWEKLRSRRAPDLGAVIGAGATGAEAGVGP